jgi:hypothetical protein
MGAGGSFGVFLFSSVATIDSSSITTGVGGNGGTGGNGARGGNGGLGGAGGLRLSDGGGNGAPGKRGGNGGAGGAGGGGAGGPSVGIVKAGSNAPAAAILPVG